MKKQLLIPIFLAALTLPACLNKGLSANNAEFIGEYGQNDKAKYIEKVKGTSQFREANIWTLVIFRELSEATEQLHFFLKHVAQYAGQIGDDRRPFALDTWENAYESWAKSVDK